MKTKKTLFAIFILAAVAISVSCGETQNKPEADTPDLQSPDPAEETDTANIGLDIEYMDLGGYEINFIVRGEGLIAFKCIDLYAETINGDIINDAIYERNTYLEEKYNFKIKATTIDEPDYPAVALRKFVLADEHIYDVCYDSFLWTKSLIQENMLTDLYTLPHIDFSKPYWDENVNKDLTIKNKLFITHGEHMLSLRAGLYGVFFNKKLAEDYQLEDLYDLVRKNKWTIDKYYSLAKGLSRDLNSDGKMDYNDFWGNVSESYYALIFYNGSGEKIAVKDENDLPVLSMNTSKGIDVLELVSQFLTDKTTTILVDDYPGKWDLVDKVFPDGRALFGEGALMITPKMRDMEVDFGILPSPKFTENQDRYYHIVSIWNAPLMSVPTTITDPDKVGYILELLAAKSVDTLTPAYYDTQLRYKLLRDDESEEMLDIILSSITFDVGLAFDFGGLSVAILTNLGKGGNFVSTYEKNERAAQRDIDKLINTLNESLN